MKALLTSLLLTAAVLPALSHAQTVNICDRTPQVRDAILEGSVGDDCADVYVWGIQWPALNLEGKQLTTLKAGDFDDLTGLQWLNLSNNQLTTLPEGVFDGLTNLQELRLHNNQLTALPEGVFDDLTKLEYLDLRGSYLVGLTPNDPLFAGLPSEVELHLGLARHARAVAHAYKSECGLHEFYFALQGLIDDYLSSITPSITPDESTYYASERRLVRTVSDDCVVDLVRLLVDVRQMEGGRGGISLEDGPGKPKLTLNPVLSIIKVLTISYHASCHFRAPGPPVRSEGAP